MSIIYRIIFLILLPIAVMANEKTTLFIGQDYAVALYDIISLKCSDEQIEILRSDGSLIKSPLVDITFGNGQSLSHHYHDNDGMHLFYDIQGRKIRDSHINSLFIIDRHKNYSYKNSFSSGCTRAVPSVLVQAMQFDMSYVHAQTSLSQLDSITFAPQNGEVCVHRLNKITSLSLDRIDRITFPELQDKVLINYSDENITATNPLYFDGLLIEILDHHVRIIDHSNNAPFICLMGNANEGSVEIETKEPYDLTLDNLHLGCNRYSIIACKNSSLGNIHIEGNNVLNNVASAEDKQSPLPCIASQGSLYISGSGSLDINTSGKVGQCIYADVLKISSSTITLKNYSKGHKEIGCIYSPICISCQDLLKILGGSLHIESTKEAGKGIVVQGPVLIGDSINKDIPRLDILCIGTTIYTPSYDASATLTEGCPALTTPESVTVLSGTINIVTKDNASQGFKAAKRIDICGGTLNFDCYDDCLNSDGPITFSGGTTVCSSTGDDAIDSDYGKIGAIVVDGGNVFAYTSKVPSEEGFDCDNDHYIIVNDGIVVTFGGAQDLSSREIGISKQAYYLGPVLDEIQADIYYSFCNTSNDIICTFKFNNVFQNCLSLLSAPDLGIGSFKILAGPTPPNGYTTSVAERFFIGGKSDNECAVILQSY